jgi:hypothetical protein
VFYGAGGGMTPHFALRVQADYVLIIFDFGKTVKQYAVAHYS